MTAEKKLRRLCRRQKYYLGIPIGVSFRQQHLQKAVLNAFRRVKAKVKVAAIKTEIKRVKKSLEKKRAELREMQVKFTQLRAEKMHALEERMRALEERAWTQGCSDAMEALLFAPHRINSMPLSD